jgi:hypothetical protein
MLSHIVFVLLAILALVAANVYSDNKNFQLYQFQQFKQTWGKSYKTPAEESTRFAKFVNFLQIIDERNRAETAANGTAIHGITQFADLSHEEFRARFLNVDISKKGEFKGKKVEITQLKDSPNADWTGVYTTPVKDQGE